VLRWISIQENDWYQQGIENIATRYNKCLYYDGDYVEKQVDINTIKFCSSPVYILVTYDFPLNT
jgi:hypothetical protein